MPMIDGSFIITALGTDLVAARKQLIAEGRQPAHLTLTTADLQRFGLLPWSGSIFGMRCEVPAETPRPWRLADMIERAGR